MRISILTIASILSLLPACEEKPLVIPELTVGNKRILVEEVTGANCPNCPEGARELNALQNQFGKENILIVSIHAGGNLSAPITGSKFDFQTQDGYDLTSYIGTLFGLPCASINRIYDPIEETPFLIGGWSARISQELDKDYGLGVFITNTYNESNRELDMKINIAPEVTIPGDLRLTVVITQDSIVDAQYDGQKLVPDYVHRHVLRDVVTKTDGDPLNVSLTANALITKLYSLKLPENWDPKHCFVVAYVHKSQGNDKEILQAAEAHAVD
jgi:hypothetical protein